MSSFGIGYRALKSFAEHQDTLAWFRYKLVDQMFRAGEKEVFAYIQQHVTKHHALPKLDTLEQAFPDIKNYPTPEPPSYYLEHLENRLYYEVINSANVESQSLLKANPGNHTQALAKLSEAMAFVSTHRYRMRIVDLAKEGSKLALTAYHNVLVAESVGKFGWKHMDESSGGLMPGDVVTIIGRPGAGKSWSLFQIAKKNWQAGHRPLVVSMEMAPLPVVQRFTAMIGGVPIGQLKKAAFSSQSYGKFTSGILQMAKMEGLFIVDGNLAASVEDVYTLARQLGCDQVYIDGAYLMRHPNPRLDKFTRVSENVELMKRYTSEANMPTVSSYQFARSAVKNKKKDEKPGLEDIGLSDSIPQVSSVVLGLFQEDTVESIESRLISVMKGRDGEIGGFRINWDFNTMNFDQVSDDQDPSQATSQLNFL